ncbi:hypothetical protein [uncultured Serinicoccus sp.]|uniref:hypothetical protein n=1 Tax=uncultured Serinicoccus sp. TaxID=735514 RepID=UPI00261D81E9|nr:hypothetical protein [uncultured Serinicoccus sp.]
MLARAALTVLGATGLHLVVLRPRVLTWGATADEVSRALPGDDLLPRPDLVATRAITIDAPVEAVWPWLAQMGQARGVSTPTTGFYRYLSRWARPLVETVSVASFVMTERMLRGIRDRA